MVPILDPHGRPYALALATGGGSGTRGNPFENLTSDGYRLRRPDLNTEIARVLGRAQHRCLLADSRYISTFPLVNGAIEQKKDYVCQAGFLPDFDVDDQDWVDDTTRALRLAHQVINVRGELISWERAWQIGCTMLDIDGDFFVLFGQTPTGFPKLQFLEAHRVGSAYGETLVADGPHAGRLILNGIIYDPLGLELAYRVLDADDPRGYRDIDSIEIGGEMMHVCTARWFSDGRPFPNVAYSIRDWYPAIEARAYQSQKHKISAAITVVEATPDGKMPEDAAREAIRRARNAAGADATAATVNRAADPAVLSLDGGLIRYIKAGQGDIRLFDNATPGDGWLDFDERLQRAAYVGMRWRYEMHNLAKLSGAPVRGFQDQINTTIYSTWSDLVPFVTKAEAVVLSKLIATGDVRANPQWMRYHYTPPADFTVDGGRSNAADLDNVRAGVDSRPELIRRYGKTSIQVLRSEGRYRQQQEKVEREFDLPSGSLATLAQPGMQPTPTTAKPAPQPTAA